MITSTVDFTKLNAYYSGVDCKYTATRSDKFSFDNFSINGSPFIDSIPPKLMSVTRIDSSSISVEFGANETLEVNTHQFEILPLASNSSSIIQSENLVYLDFENSFPIN